MAWDRSRENWRDGSRSSITVTALLGSIAVVLLVTAMALATSQVVAGQGAGEAAGILAVVPGGRLGEYRHGTYPSSGNRTHMGVDIPAPCGTPVLALEAGTVVSRISSRSGPDFRSFGYALIVEHPASITGRVFYSLYLHFQEPPTAGEHVERGEQLGRVGATGRATGCHLHLEVRYFRDWVSPQWKNIYGPGDQRASRHFRENWEDPVTFIARLEHERQAAELRRHGREPQPGPRPS